MDDIRNVICKGIVIGGLSLGGTGTVQL